MANGPKKPARLPTELITAMPAAAAAPDRNAVGSVQNTGSTANTPNAPIEGSHLQRRIVEQRRQPDADRRQRERDRGMALALHLPSERWPNQTMPIDADHIGNGADEAGLHIRQRRTP